MAAAAALGRAVSAAAIPAPESLGRAAGLAAALLVLLPARSFADSYFLTIAGLGGTPDYEQRFNQEAQDLDRLLKAAGPTTHVRTLSGPAATREAVMETLTQIAGEAHPGDDFILVLIGHGSFDGVQYKLALPGPDITAGALAAACAHIRTSRQLIVNTTSSSGASVALLAQPGRAVIAATKTGTEKNVPVFARYWVEALQDPQADVNKDDAISALEAFEYATTKTAAYYESQKRLATEHAVFEDAGGGGPAVRAASTDSGAGRMLASLTLVRLGKQDVAAAANPHRRELLARKEQLLSRIDTLKYQRAAMSPQDYKQGLTEALVALAKVQLELDKPDLGTQTDKPPDLPQAPELPQAPDKAQELYR
jgi:hypothetical protein